MCLEIHIIFLIVNAVLLKAKLVMVPMYPSLVAGTMFLTVVILVCLFSMQSGGEFLASWL